MWPVIRRRSALDSPGDGRYVFVRTERGAWWSPKGRWWLARTNAPAAAQLRLNACASGARWRSATTAILTNRVYARCKGRVHNAFVTAQVLPLAIRTPQVGRERGDGAAARSAERADASLTGRKAGGTSVARGHDYGRMGSWLPSAVWCPDRPILNRRRQRIRRCFPSAAS